MSDTTREGRTGWLRGSSARWILFAWLSLVPGIELCSASAAAPTSWQDPDGKKERLTLVLEVETSKIEVSARTHTHTLTCIIYVAIPSFFDLYSIYILYIISVYMCVCMFILLILFWGVLLA